LLFYLRYDLAYESDTNIAGKITLQVLLKTTSISSVNWDASNSVVYFAGFAYRSSTCSSGSVSLVEENFDAITYTVAAHELGHR
jgi:hypothetical protein